MKHHKKLKLGFTLIELLIVIGILGILTSLLLANMQNARARGRDARRKKDLNELRTALRMYYNDYQSYPAADSNGRIRGCNPLQTFSWGSAFVCGTTTYMSVLPNDPVSSQTYYYTQQSGGEGFSLYACLENRSDQEGGSDCGGLSCSTSWCFKVSQD